MRFHFQSVPKLSSERSAGLAASCVCVCALWLCFGKAEGEELRLRPSSKARKCTEKVNLSRFIFEDLGERRALPLILCVELVNAVI